MSSAPLHTCSRCHRGTASPFAQGGLCLRCAGERALGFDLEGVDPIPTEVSEDLAPAAFHGVGLPDRIGPYEIIEELGRGGMARVFAARQMRLGRIVALKVLATNPAGSELEQRFLREAQTVARLRHAQIVAVHDFGRTDGCVYFSMDYIEGGDLAHRMRAQPYAPREAAEVIQKVATALAYAHGEGVLHRDLKPSNILLDGAEPRLADFGLAAQLGASGDLTAASSVLGTPHYLAPEALRKGSAALSVASDVYALGVVLYELLVGRTPFAGASPAELPGLMETNEPPPIRLAAPAVPRDLETIGLKCLEREPGQRYATAGALAEDLRRFLAGEPIIAQPLGRLGRWRKFARRHRASLAAAMVVVAVLLVAAVGGTVLAVRATRAERRATSEAESATALSNFYQSDILGQAAPAGQFTTDLKLRTVLDGAAKKLEGRFPDQPSVEASMRETLAGSYRALGAYAEEERQLVRALDLRRKVLGPDDPATFLDLSRLAMAMSQAGKLKQAVPLARQAATTSKRVLGTSNPATLHAYNGLVSILTNEGKLDEAERTGRVVLGQARAALGPNHEETRDALTNLSGALFAEEKNSEAEPLNVEALAVAERTIGPEAAETLNIMSNLASVYWAAEKYEEAETLNRRIYEIRRRTIGAEHPETLRSMNNLATTLEERGKFQEAAALLEQARELRRRVLGPEHADTISVTANLARIDQKLGRNDEACRLAAESADAARRYLGVEHFKTLLMMLNQFRIERACGRLAEAEGTVRDLSALADRLKGPTSKEALVSLGYLGDVLLMEKKYPEASQALETCLTRRLSLGAADWQAYLTQSQLGQALAGGGELAKAEPLLTEASHWFETHEAEVPLYTRKVIAEAAARVGDFYVVAGRTEEAGQWRVAHTKKP